jgi:predicted permease
MSRRGERVFGWLLLLYPREFRAQYGEDVLAFFRADRAHPKYGTGPMRPLHFWSATVRDLVRAAWRQRRRQRRERTARPHGIRMSLGRLSQDVRFAWRGLRASPGVTLAALTVLTLGIGAGTAIFSVVDAVVLRGLPFEQSSRLVRVSETDLETGRPSTVAPQNYADWLAMQDVFESIGAIAGAGTFVTRDEPVEPLIALRATASLFDVLRVRPARGRALLPSDERPDAPPVAVISDALWRRRYHSDPSVLGRLLASRTGVVRIVGIMPPGFTYPVSVTASRSSVDLWVPFTWTDAMVVRGQARNYLMSVVARLAPGVSVDDASRRMTAIRDVLAAKHPGWFADHGVLVRRLQDAIIGASVRSWMFLLLGAVGVVLVMACLNVAHLLVARAVGRGPELAVRAALGASRWDLARLLLVQSLLLSFLGAVAGVLAAVWGVELLRATLPGSVPRLADVAVDARVLTVAGLVALASGALFGTIPALEASRPDVITLLGRAGRSQVGGRVSRRIRSVLVVVEVALAVVMLAGAALFASSFHRVSTVELGFDPARVLSFLDGHMSTSHLVPPSADDRVAVQGGHVRIADAIARIAAIPGVVTVSAMQGGTPLSGSYVTVPVQHADGRTPPFTGPDEVVVRSVDASYLDVLKGSLVQGRWIHETDRAGTEPVVVVNEEAARRYFGAREAVGARILMGDYVRTVIGVVESMRWRGPETEINPEAFIPFAQTAHPGAQLLVRVADESPRLVQAIQEAVRGAMPGTTVNAPIALERNYAALIAQRRFNMIVLGLFGLVAVAIAAIGIYGLMAFVVAQRRREFGVRVALGAVPSGLLATVIGGALRLMVAGLVPGLMVAALLEGYIRSFLFDARPHDPIVYGGVAVLLLASGVLAAVGPARRATRVDPLVALRSE